MQKMELKKPLFQQPPRHFTVVGGSNSLPSLREVVRHRNPAARRLSQKKLQIKNIPVSKAKDRCGLCVKTRHVWQDTDNCRQPSQYADMILVSEDRIRFYCNAFLLAVWSNRLLDNVQHIIADNQDEWTVELHVQGDVLAIALRFMHGGTVEDIPWKHLGSVVSMAKHYKITELKLACYEAVKTIRLTIDNSCYIWLFCHENKLLEAGDRAMRFVYKNIAEIQAGPGLSSVSTALMYELFYASARWTIPIAEESDIKRPGPVSSSLREIWHESSGLTKPCGFSDVVIVTKEGRHYNVHRQLLHFVAPAFARRLQDDCQSHGSAEVEIKDVDGDAVHEFLRGLYQMKQSENFSKLADLVYILARAFQVDDLAARCERETCTAQIGSIEAALRMLRDAEEHRMLSTKSMCFRYLYENAAWLRDHPEFKRLVSEEPQMLAEIMIDSKRYRQMIINDCASN